MKKINWPWARKSAADVMAGAETSANILSFQGATPLFNPGRAEQSMKSWVYIAAWRNAVALAGTPLRLYAATGSGMQEPKIAPFRRLDGHAQKSILKQAPSNLRSATGAVEITEHPFLDLMREVNEHREGAEHLVETILWLQATGDAYWLLTFGTGVLSGVPVEMWLLPSTLVTVIPDAKKFIRGYYYGKGAKRVELPPERVVHLREPSIRSLYNGGSKIEAGWSAIAGNEAMNEYEEQTARSPLPSLFMQSKKPLTPRQRRELADDMQRSLMQGGAGADARPLVADTDFNIEKLSWSPREISSPVGRRLRREEILNTFDQTMGLYSENANRANAQAAIYMWARFGLDPLGHRIAEKINATLIRKYDAGNRLFCAFDAVAQEDRDVALRELTADVQLGIRTANEVRAERGLTPLSEPKAAEQGPQEKVRMRAIQGGAVHDQLKGVAVGLLAGDEHGGTQ